MKTKRILALILALVMMMACFVSCRTKDEIAYTFTYGDKTVNVRTALYMCFLFDADIEFQNKAVAAADEAGTEYKDYKELKYEDKDYVTWTKDKAKELAEKYAYAEIEFERLGFTIGEEEQSYIDYYADSQWNGNEYYGGISEIYEANGVSYKTYLEYFANSYWKQEMVYGFYTEDLSEAKDEHDHDHEGEEGTTAKGTTATEAETTTKKALPAEVEKLRGSLRPDDKAINSTLKNNFVPVYIIDVSFIDEEGNEKDKDTLASDLKTLKGYADQLNDGADFAKIYSSYQVVFGVTADSSTTESAENYEQVLLSAKANKVADNGDEADENFAKALKLKVGEAVVIENEDCYALVLRRDILKDKDASKYAYSESYTSSAIDILVKDKYEADIMNVKIKEFKCKVNASAIKFYSPEKIDYLEETTTPAASELAVQ